MSISLFKNVWVIFFITEIPMHVYDCIKRTTDISRIVDNTIYTIIIKYVDISYE